MDKKLDPIEAVELSWKLTRGHGWRIFAMGLASFFIIIFGLCLFLIGIFPAMMWISCSFATLYQSVLLEKEKPAEIKDVAVQIS
jgi:NhaP-type Na+/H+ or K+/H+ antiporter